MLVLTMGLALALIPIVLYPLGRKYSEPLALGYLVFRGALESIAYIAMVIAWVEQSYAADDLRGRLAWRHSALR